VGSLIEKNVLVFAMRSMDNEKGVSTINKRKSFLENVLFVWFWKSFI